MTDDINISEATVRDTGKKKAALKGRLSQLMIFVNGLVLTVTAFATLMIFMDQMHDAKMKNLNNMVLKNFSVELDGMMNAFAFVPSLDTQADNIEIQAGAGIMNKFDGVYRLQKVRGQWRVQKMTDGSAADTNDLRRLIRSVIEIGAIDGIALTSIDGRDNNIVAAMGDGAGGYYAGVVRSDLFAAAMDTDNGLYRIRLFNDRDGAKLLTLENTQTDETVDHAGLIQMIGQIKLGDKTYGMTTEIKSDPFYTFVSKLPYLLLLFGGTLTIVGSLYVRNNQKQGHQLAAMNAILDSKNKALQLKIEESKSLYEQILDKDKEYESVLNAVQDILFEVDKTGQIQFMNAAWADMTGLKADDVIDSDLFSYFDIDQATKLRKVFAVFLQDKKPVAENALIQINQNSRRAVEIIFSVVRENRDGEVRIIGSINDIEEKQRAKQALNEVEKRYKTIVENAAGGIYQITPKGQIMSGNPALARILGYDDIDELVADDFNMNAAFTSNKDRRAYEIALNKDGFIRNHETELRQSNGNLIWVNENARCVRDLDGSILYYEGSIEDISQRKQAENELMQEKLNSDLASRAKSEFLANMSHELRTPLNAIIGFSEIIKGEALGAIENKNYVDYAKDIHESGGRLLNVINEILGISKIEAGERNLSESVVNIGHVMDTCTNLLAAKIEAHSLDVSNMIDETTPSIVAEELAFKQIFMNLLSNAIKFTPENGKITISSEYEDGGDLRLSITDTGVGMDEADIPKALSPFGQLDNSMSRSNAGTGLGLTLVSSLVHLHGGRLEMISQKGIGTTVTIIVPARRVAVKKVADANKDAGDNVASLRDYKNK